MADGDGSPADRPDGAGSPGDAHPTTDPSAGRRPGLFARVGRWRLRLGHRAARAAAVARAGERALVRDLFVRALGLVIAIAFLSLLDQVELLYGSTGLQPAGEYLELLRERAAFLGAPSIFWWTGAENATLWWSALIGAGGGLLLVIGLVPRYALIMSGLLYLSFLNVDHSFLTFQWDNLLVETTFFALFVTPGGLRLGGRPEPHPVGVFLMLWLLFRLNVESGAAKLLGGTEEWRNLTAMASYYETAPIPTRLAWYAHQLPLWVHKTASLLTYVVEIGAPLLIWWRSRHLRFTAFVALAYLQFGIILTANYGFFNYLSLALTLFVLDDAQLRAALALIGLSPRPRPVRPPAHRITDGLRVAATAVLVPLSIAPFARFLDPPAWLRDAARSINTSVLQPTRAINAYHLFVSMTIQRPEVVIEGSMDGTDWKPYELRYKPGDPLRRPPFVAPHQPRVDFKLWFLLLGPPDAWQRELYFIRLLHRLLTDPDRVAPLFERDPFAGAAPRFVRLTFYRYTFTDAATRAATGRWWNRERLGGAGPFTADMFE